MILLLASYQIYGKLPKWLHISSIAGKIVFEVINAIRIDTYGCYFPALALLPNLTKTYQNIYIFLKQEQIVIYTFWID